MRFDAVVVGAGLAGSTAARLLAEKGLRVLVAERRRSVGGNCHDALDPSGVRVHSHGPHIFHTDDRAVWEFLSRFAFFRPYQHRVLSYAGGRLHPFPLNLDSVNQVYGTALPLDGLEAFLAAEASKAACSRPPANFRDAVVSQVGQRLYELFFRGYTRKQWEREPEELSAELAARVPLRLGRDDRYFTDIYQGLPEDGYTAMVERMLDHPGISLLLGTDWFSVRAELQAGLTVYTGELDRFFDFSRGRLEYRSLRLEFLRQESGPRQAAAVVNYPNDYDWTRITDFGLLCGQDGRGGCTVLCREYPAAQGEPYYVVPDQANRQRREEYLRMAASLESAGTHIFVGRLAEYRYYDMDDAVRAAMDKVQGR
jgi:UDP-galactopyranose mutase